MKAKHVFESVSIISMNFLLHVNSINIKTWNISWGFCLLMPGNIMPFPTATNQRLHYKHGKGKVELSWKSKVWCSIDKNRVYCRSLGIWRLQIKKTEVFRIFHFLTASILMFEIIMSIFRKFNLMSHCKAIRPNHCLWTVSSLKPVVVHCCGSGIFDSVPNCCIV